MSLAQPYRPESFLFYSGGKSNRNMGVRATAANFNGSYDNCPYDSNFYITTHDDSFDFSRRFMPCGPNYDGFWTDTVPSSKRRKFSDFSCESTGRPYQQQFNYEHGPQNEADLWQRVPPNLVRDFCNGPVFRDSSSAFLASSDSSAYASVAPKRDRSRFEDDEVVFMSRDEIERCSPSRKDGIDVLHETRLRYSYCAFLQNLGLRLDLPQTTIGTAMVLCHRFFVRRSHASHDRFLIATATLFLASKSEETARPLNDVLKVSSEILHGQDFAILSFMLPLDWFEQYRERILEAEQLILTTLNFELGVQHPYESLTSTLQKLGFSQSGFVNLALSLISEGLRSSLWLQFKPHHIAAGAAYLASKYLNLNLSSSDNVWKEFHTPPSVLRDVAHQLMELF
ncbi:Cyclin-T1-4 [Striga hermonthica]|uniref:Cyclin-T1-4 n=1 Tax=Striga hermonthica TaxID=68872 RepID=A0A9N7NHK7_STRHE|nr:Cyclin-T1-4 [Striga hermonthica]